MNKEHPDVCCVIVQNHSGEILLIKRGREPYKDMWSLISGIGYTKQGLSLEDGVKTEVIGDIKVVPENTKHLFDIVDDNLQKVSVYSAEVGNQEILPQKPYVTEVKWFNIKDISSLVQLAFGHNRVLSKFTEQA